MRIAVVGATGLVGRTMIRLLETRPWAEAPPRLLASARSAGSTLPFRGIEVTVEDVAGFDPATVDLALFSAGGALSRELAPRFAEAGTWVVDNSSAWRMDSDTALVVPEINAAALPAAPAIVANPNCSTIQIVMALAPLHAAFGLESFHAATYQSVSGAGATARHALLQQIDARRPDHPEADLKPSDAGPFGRPVAFDAVPAIGAALDDGSFEEEAKVVRESRKILGLPDLKVSCMAVRVPSWNGHGAAVRAVFANDVDRDRALTALEAFLGVTVTTSPHDYAAPSAASGRDDVFVGRLRTDPDDPCALTFWVAADNLLKGAALNAVQIAEALR